MNSPSKRLHRNIYKIGRIEDNQKFCEELDNIQKQFCREDNQEEDYINQKINKKSTYKKPDRQKKIREIKAYENALKQHRKTCSEYYNPFSNDKKIQLCIAEEQTIKLAEEAIECQSKAPAVLRSIGFKRLKIVSKVVAKQHFQSIVNYLKTRSMPVWLKNHFEALMKNNVVGK